MFSLVFGKLSCKVLSISYEVIILIAPILQSIQEFCCTEAFIGNLKLLGLWSESNENKIFHFLTWIKKKIKIEAQELTPLYRFLKFLKDINQRPMKSVDKCLCRFA